MYVLRKDSKTYYYWQLGMIFCIFFMIWINNWAVQHGNGEMPKLYGDAGLYYLLAQQLQNGVNISDLRQINYLGYPYFLYLSATLLQLPLLLSGLWANIMLGGGSALLLRSITISLTKSESAGRWVLVFFFLSAQIISTNVYLMKDPLLMFCSLVSLKMLLQLRQKIQIVPIIVIITMLVAIAMLRIPMVGVLIVFAGCILTTGTAVSFKKILQLVLFAVVAGAGLIAYNWTISSNMSSRNYLADSDILTVEMDHIGAWSEESSSNSMVSALVAGNQNWSLGKKILYAPVFTAIQMATPINIWYFSEDPKWYPEINWMIWWYLLILPLILYSMIHFKSFSDSPNKMIFALGIMGYVSFACLFGGVVPRYALFFQAILLIFGAYAWARALENPDEKRRLSLFFSWYATTGIALFVCYLVYKI